MKTSFRKEGSKQEVTVWSVKYVIEPGQLQCNVLRSENNAVLWNRQHSVGVLPTL